MYVPYSHMYTSGSHYKLYTIMSVENVSIQTFKWKKVFDLEF